AFNLLLLFLPIAAILYLDVYEARLLDSQERAMGQQARILAAALSGSAPFDTASATAVIARVERGDARLRVYDSAGTLATDSNRIITARAPAAASIYPAAGSGVR